MNIFSNDQIIHCGVIQLAPRINDIDKNLNKVSLAIEECVTNKCQLVVLPEAFATSLELPRLNKIAEKIPGPITYFLKAKAKENNIYLVAGIAEAFEDNIYSSSVLIDHKGEILSTYRRMHVYDLENRFIASGNSVQVTDTPFGRIGMIIGYDLNFPEACRLLFASKVEIIVCPSQLLVAFTKAIRSMALSRAAENCCYFIHASSTGANTLAGLTFMGNSLIARSPIGLSPYSLEYQNETEVLAEAKREETILYADLDLVKLRREQMENPHYNNSLELQYSRKGAPRE